MSPGKSCHFGHALCSAAAGFPLPSPPSRGLLFTNVHVPPCRVPPVSRPSPPHDARISSTPRPRSGNGTGRPHRYSSCLPRNHYTERASERGAFCNIRHGGRQRSRSTRGGAWAGWLAARTCNASRKTLRFRFKNTTQKCTCARPSERGFERPSIKFPYEFPNSAMDSSACPRRSLSAPKTRWQCEKKRIELLST